MKASKLFQNLSLGPYVLQNRIVLPPLTRSRSTQPGNIPNELMATYYQQRAGAGFMVTEGTQIEPRGQGYAWTPGIYSPEQIAVLKEALFLHNFGMLGVFHIHLCNPIMHYRSRPRLLGLTAMLKSLLKAGPMQGPWLILQCHVL